MQENTAQQMKNSRRKTYNISTLNFLCQSLKILPKPNNISHERGSWLVTNSMMVYCGSGRYDMIWQYDDPHMTTWQNDDPHINGGMAKWRYAYEYHPWCISGRVIKRSGADKHFELAAHCDMLEICLLVFGVLLQA